MNKEIDILYLMKIANSTDQDQTPHNGASDQDSHCLPSRKFWTKLMAINWLVKPNFTIRIVRS